ncbi:unnamed protein product [Polarella glacialis]|uniref:Ubiquitin-like domain-containing protein n=1 Tax=Polarella glacialis TaxID=89957 RepID=A0A813DE12_POLGL|nr:unnamed protein product [Polarella glacialis]
MILLSSVVVVDVFLMGEVAVPAAVTSDKEVELTVVSLGGNVLARVKVNATAPVRFLKAAIADATGVEASKQFLAIGRRKLSRDTNAVGTYMADGELGESCTTATVTLCVYSLAPIHVDFSPYETSFEITSVCVEGLDIVANLGESPCSILARVQLKESFLEPENTLFWASRPVEGDSPIRDALVELVSAIRSVPSGCMDGTTAILSLRPRPGRLSSSSLLYGLPTGRYLGTHAVGESVYGSWG